MNWKDKCLPALDAGKVFENSAHRTRFTELMDCFSDYPFFTKGLCKCMYLSSWDEEHFLIMLQTLTDMALEKERDTEDMRIHGDILADENAEAKAAGEAYMYQMAGTFLEGRKFDPKGMEQLPEKYQHIVRRGMEVAEIIDEL